MVVTPAVTMDEKPGHHGCRSRSTIDEKLYRNSVSCAVYVRKYERKISLPRLWSFL